MEEGFDLAGVGALPDDSLGGAVSREQAEGTEEDAFAGTCLASHDGEACPELKGGGIHQGEIFYPQGAEHGA